MVCGIAGILIGPSQSPVEPEELLRMAAILRHRGPDGYGLYRDRHIGLAHTRLSIIDLTGGAQPIQNEDESVWVTFNGEIFNYVELRAELEEAGHRFRTATDTEVVVHAYEEYGSEAWTRLNGQFAFGLWDSRAGVLTLVRDRVGILPLYYANAPNAIVFASEIKAIFATGRMAPCVDPAALGQVFTSWSVVPPRTMFLGVSCVPPGSALTIDVELNARVSRYWQFEPSSPPRDSDPDDSAQELGERLRAAVRLRLRADVPVGAYLSGGLDSSVICRLIRDERRGPFETFAVRFVDAAFDETPAQRRMVAELDVAHHEIVCDGGGISTNLPELIWHCECPLLRTAPAPLFLLSGLVRDRGRKVVLTGEGADELFAGYDLFKEDKARRFWARRPESTRRAALLSRVHNHVRPGETRNAMWTEFFRRRLLDVEDPFYAHRVRWDNTGWTLRFLVPDAQASFATESFEDEVRALLPSGWERWPTLSRAQLVEWVTFLSPYLLSSQGDRVAMSHGVEVRYPFLDPDVIDFCRRLPPNYKLLGFRDKFVLRKFARRVLPRDISDRPKQPYRAPMTTALFADGEAECVAELLSPRMIARYGWIDPDAAGLLLAKARRHGGVLGGEREEMALVGLLTLQWLGHWFLDRFGARVADARRALTARPDVYRDRLS